MFQLLYADISTTFRRYLNHCRGYLIFMGCVSDFGMQLYWAILGVTFHTLKPNFRGGA